MSADIALPPIEDIRRVALNPGDVLVIRVPDQIGRDHADAIKAVVARVLPDHQSLVLSGGATLDVLTREHVEHLLADDSA